MHDRPAFLPRGRHSRHGDGGAAVAGCAGTVGRGVSRTTARRARRSCREPRERREGHPPRIGGRDRAHVGPAAQRRRRPSQGRHHVRRAAGSVPPASALRDAACSMPRRPARRGASRCRTGRSRASRKSRQARVTPSSCAGPRHVPQRDPASSGPRRLLRGEHPRRACRGRHRVYFAWCKRSPDASPARTRPSPRRRSTARRSRGTPFEPPAPAAPTPRGRCSRAPSRARSPRRP